MSKGFLGSIAAIGRAVGRAVTGVFQLFGPNRRWRPISTAPSNQELELRIMEDGKASTVEFPCLRTNEGAWIDVDLGNTIKLEPTQWRLWPHGKSPRAHHTRIKPSDRSELYHRHGKIAYRDDTVVEE